jgi:transcriptional regulator with GAF, ATPase, and Fis domain
MIHRLRLAGVLSELDAEVQAIEPVDGFGLLLPDNNGQFTFLSRSPWGNNAYAFAAADLPAPFRVPLSEPAQFTPLSPDYDLGRPLDAMFARSGLERLTLAPLPSGLGTFWTATRSTLRLTDEKLRAHVSLAGSIDTRLAAGEATVDALRRLHRLDALENLLPALADALDVREVFSRFAAIVGDVLPHDTLVLLIPTGDRRLGQFYAGAGSDSATLPEMVELPPNQVLTDAWRYFIIDDLRAHPEEAQMTAAIAGFRSSLRVPIRLRDQFFGGLNIMSLDPRRYSGDDLFVATRLADHVALALSHARLAEQARQGEVLKARTANVELLDELLATVTDTRELRDAFDRISAIAKTVLPHDALMLPVLLPDGLHGTVYASSGSNTPFPEIVNAPAAAVLDQEWEYQIIDDLQALPEEAQSAPAQMGYRSCLRMPIRLDGKFAAGLIFMSFAPSVYSPGDVLVARRMADRVALSLSREKRAEASKRADVATARAAQLEGRVRQLTEELDARTGFRKVVGESPQWRRVLTQATQVASTETTVLLLGDSGTGKEVIARFLHRASRRSDGPFVALNCAALPEQLLEAELFGYERGAFTGATQSKPGQLEQASGGTLFLDEVAEMNPASQAKFLRVLQEREFQRLGGTRVLKTDARIIAATNRDLHKAMACGLFREDLYYRLNVFAIQLPPLRERRDDVMPLSEAFIAEIGRAFGRPPAGISREAGRALIDYDWPGNVRELRNVLERAAILCDGGLIAAEHLALRPHAPPVAIPSEPVNDPVAAAPAKQPGSDLKSVERRTIEQALADARFNKSQAAKLLGLSRAQLYSRLRRHGLE